MCRIGLRLTKSFSEPPDESIPPPVGAEGSEGRLVILAPCLPLNTLVCVERNERMRMVLRRLPKQACDRPFYPTSLDSDLSIDHTHLASV